MQQKVQALRNLNATLRAPKQLSGVFLPSGARERDDLLLLAEMPSMATPKTTDPVKQVNFGATARDSFFKDMLQKHGLSGVYVTDVVKQRAQPRPPTREEILEWRPFLLQEIEILDPKVIIVIGRRTYEQSFLPHILPALKSQISHDYIFHYCSQVSRAKFAVRLAVVVEKYSLAR